MAKTSELAAAYLATTYRIFLPTGICDLRANQPSVALQAWLEASGASRFAIITGHNPASERMAAETNQRRQGALQRDLLSRAYPVFPGENLPDDPRWPMEESCCVINMPLAEARELACQYGQNALVFGIEDGLPQLYWIEK